ncbi:MAG TPA: response regulator transcription factor [Catalimonadaceae bacterium]|jgi:two-component system alkaline phosphatase synthesis response regulator PhoP|nr:response regulator transcription factor [Catalimonadaceae bacterium]
MAVKNGLKALVVDDDADILDLLQYNLSKEGFEVRTAENGKKAIEVAKAFQPNLILLDIMMPVMDGVEACRLLREIPALSNSFIVFLTSRSEEYSEVAAFDVGADDFINKPIKPRALISRIHALFRRTKAPKADSSPLVIGGLTIDRTSYTVTLDGKSLSLPKKEFELLLFLAQNPNKVFTRDDLLQNIWGSDVFVLSRTVDVHIRKVREKIGDGYISTTKGVGYKFEYKAD